MKFAGGIVWKRERCGWVDLREGKSWQKATTPSIASGHQWPADKTGQLAQLKLFIFAIITVVVVRKSSKRHRINNILKETLTNLKRKTVELNQK